MYERKDHFYKRAKKEGLVSRAAYKLLEIQKKFEIWRPGYSILDLGCAPGGWLQILAKEVGPKGQIIGVDLLPLKIQPPPNVLFFQKNIEDLILDNPVDVILSDLSPDLSGIAFRDTYLSYELAKRVWGLAQKYLKKNGNMVIKIFPGEESNHLKTDLKNGFAKFHIFVPQATRSTSSEVYWVCLSLNK